jgi:hypothetical protein
VDLGALAEPDVLQPIEPERGDRRVARGTQRCAPFQKRPGSRRSVFEELDRPALRPLLRQAFVLQEWSRHRAHIDYHVTIDEHRYSVPHQLIKQELDVRATSATIEVFHDGMRVASHARSSRRGGFTTVREHMPPAHQEIAGVNQQSLLRTRRASGPPRARSQRRSWASAACHSRPTSPYSASCGSNATSGATASTPPANAR